MRQKVGKEAKEYKERLVKDLMEDDFMSKEEAEEEAAAWIESWNEVAREYSQEN